MFSKSMTRKVSMIELYHSSCQGNRYLKKIFGLYCYFSLFLIIRELGENMTDDELRAMIDEFDRDGDGESK